MFQTYREVAGPLPQSPIQIPPRLHRSLQLALFAASITWVVASLELASRAARGLVVRFAWSDGYLLLEGVFRIFLLTLGFAMLEGIVRRGAPLRRTIGLPRRPTAAREWATGGAIGWSVVLLAVLPMAIAGRLSIRLWLEPHSFWLLALNLAIAALLSLASEMAFRGYPYQRLIDTVGPAWATVLMAVLSALAAGFAMQHLVPTYLSMIVAVVLAVALSSAWLRTHGLWLGWGLHFAWIASAGILFGLPVPGIDNLSTVVETRAIGARWLTGGEMGPAGALLTPFLLVGAIVVVVLVSRDWAWDYTRKPLIPAGIPMDVPAPAAHEAMERQSAPAAPALVQILPATPQGRSVEPER
jgi:membrane protease YdiL (CAAX protease family)